MVGETINPSNPNPKTTEALDEKVSSDDHIADTPDIQPQQDTILQEVSHNTTEPTQEPETQSQIQQEIPEDIEEAPHPEPEIPETVPESKTQSEDSSSSQVQV